MKSNTHTTNAQVGRSRSTGIARADERPVSPTGSTVVPLMRELDPSQIAPLEEPKGSKWRGLLARLGIVLLTLTVLVGGWWALAVLGNYPPYLLPTPPLVAERAWSMVLSGSLFAHFWTTFLEAAFGFLLALAAGLILGYRIAHSHLLEKLISPYIGVSQGLPVIALAPLLVIWFKDDLWRNAVIVALIVFFPILVNTVVGLRSIDRSMLEVARMSGANRWQTIFYVEAPLSLRAVLGGIKLGLTLSITGAVIGELISANSGLGFLLAIGRNNYDTPLMFVGLVSLAVLTMTLYALVTVLERAIIDWE